MGELGALFNPGMRHELEERRARAARREEEGNARDGDLRIDLDSGVAVINLGADDGNEQDAEKSDPKKSSHASNGPDEDSARKSGGHDAADSAAARSGPQGADNPDSAN